VNGFFQFLLALTFMKKLIYMQILLLLFYSLPAFGQNDSINNAYAVEDTLQADLELFSNDEILEISLRFDITYYTRKKPKDEYLDAILTYRINDKDSINKEIRLKSRGEFRNQFCDFPPIRLNFKKAKFNSDELNNIEKLKLVTHCQYGNEENLFKEYLVYRLYNVLTENSFRVRLLKISYIDTNPKKKNKSINAYGFLIEPLNLLADRTNSIPVISTTLNQTNIIPEMMDRLAIFNYMVGNTDWSVTNQHNCKVLCLPNSTMPDLGMIVPYDFDYTGLVDARYAVPTEGLGINSVRERIYVGICRSEEVFRNALLEFSDKKEEFYRIINEFPNLSEKTKKKMLRYLDEFYTGIEKRNIVIRNLLNNCKKL